MIRFLLGLLLVTLLQTTLAHRVGVAGIRPDLYLLFLFFLSFRVRSEAATAMGFLLGLYQDAFSGAPLGLHAFTLSVGGFVLTGVAEGVDASRIFPRLVLLASSGLALGTLAQLLLHFFRLDPPVSALVTVVLPTALYTALLGGAVLGASRLKAVLEVRL
ncbi:MAG TPA: rod shape-determining protein MreD [Candidatus Methylomirabilis sp.]|jgi:rod shape-determining protein MreD|nr:rod shape-determining protein MreD [Candidatus Methylomirabilis sp.]